MSYQIAVIIGAYGSVGVPVSKALSAAGYELVVVGQNDGKLQALKSDILEDKASENKPLHVVSGIDVGSVQSVQDAAQRIKSLIGDRKVDVVVFAVTRGLYNDVENPLEGTDSETIAEAFKVKIGGMVNVVKSFIPLATENARFLLTGGAAGVKVYMPLIATGAATNAALLGFVKSVNAVVREKNKVLLTAIQIAGMVGSSGEQGISNDALGRAYVSLAQRQVSEYSDEEYTFPQQ